MTNQSLGRSGSPSSPSGISAELDAFCKLLGLTVAEWARLVKVCSTQELVVIHELLRVRSFRSMARRQTAEDIRAWLRAETPYLKPLSRYRFEKYKPMWPVVVKFPALPAVIPRDVEYAPDVAHAEDSTVPVAGQQQSQQIPYQLELLQAH